MRLKIILVVLFLSAILLQSCAMDSTSDYQKRRLASEQNAGAEDASAKTPNLVVEEVLNCSDSTKCHIEEIQNSALGVNSINGLIVAEPEALTGTNINKVPYRRC